MSTRRIIERFIARRHERALARATAKLTESLLGWQGPEDFYWLDHYGRLRHQKVVIPENVTVEVSDDPAENTEKLRAALIFASALHPGDKKLLH